MAMKLTADNFDLWVFRRTPEIEYLLLHTSQDKADRFFGGGRFWQIPTDALCEDENIEDAAHRALSDFGLNIVGLWVAEHTYTIYNRRRREVSVISVFAAEVELNETVKLTWEHSEFGWFNVDECMNRVHFRGLKDGLLSVREYVTATATPAPELKLL